MSLLDDVLKTPSPVPEVTQSQERIYDGTVIHFRKDMITNHNGEKRVREVVEHPGGVVVLPVLDDGRLLLVSQYRYAIGQMLLEFPAGKLEPGEEPDTAIRRELLEETGYEAAHWESLHHIYTAPGFCDERLWLYRATGLTHVEEAKGDGDECIEPVILTLQQAIDHVKSGHIVDAKTVSLLFWAVTSQ